ncbi:MAG TPA: AtpZ/AtpI family protein [Candidatus Saccharimonadales bacterium]|nr:AtpZ/AtpI family protein [Candidatus Saccharimonadales bacterium]
MGNDRKSAANSKGKPAPSSSKGNSAIFMVALLDMSWRLALSVLVPIVGGFELDQHLGTTPALTIIGFLVAMAGVFLILKRTVAHADERFRPNGAHK